MMVLIAVNDNNEFQVVSIVSNLDEATEMAQGYMAFAPEDGLLAPSEFQLHSRGKFGHFVTVQKLDL